jgi:PAS domain S-box-containing protein
MSAATAPPKAGPSQAAPAPARPLARLIAQLAALLLAPALGLGIFTAFEQTSRIRAGLEAAFFYAGRAAAAAVDTEIETRLFLLGALANFYALDDAAGEPSRIRLAPFGGRILFLPAAGGGGMAGGDDDAAGAPGQLEQLAAHAIDQGAPAFPLVPQPDGRVLPVVLMPVQRDEIRLGALGMRIEPGTLDEALRLPGLPEGSGILLVGAGGEVIARSSEAVLPGLRRWPLDQTQALRGAHGLGLVPARVGAARVLLQAEAVERAGWTVVVVQPEAGFAANWRDPALQHIAGGLAIVAAGLLAAVWFARRLLAGLPGAAAPTRRPRAALRVAEFEAADAAIHAANAALRREAERSAAVAAENSRLAREAQNDRRLLRSVVESAPDPIFVKDRALRYVMVNTATARSIGRPAADILGRRDAEVLPEELARRLGEQDRLVMASDRPMEFEDEVPLGPAGETSVMLTTKSPWRAADGEVAGVVGISRDVTRRREAETQLRAAEAAMRRLARADSLTVMSVGIAHELNQPLTAAANYLGAALRWLERAGGEARATAQARAAIAEAAAETQRAGGILRSLRDFIDRGETGQADVALGVLVSETVALLSAARGGEELPVTLDFPDQPVTVRAGRLQLQQVLVNLLRNAIEATEGQPERGLAVSLSVVGGQARLAVLDRGPGLAPEVRARLFEPFVSTSASGMGMGLSICRTIVEAQGGRIAAEARPGGGTAFVLSLPLAPALPEAAPLAHLAAGDH